MRLQTRWLATLAMLASAILASGCATSTPRDILPEKLVDEAELVGMRGVRFWGDASSKSFDAVIQAEAPKLRALAEGRMRPGQSHALNLLAVSGGGEDGAFGAGLLVGWGDAGTRPDFDVVTGVSAGALIAPFVFLGRERDLQLRELFTSYSQQDILVANVPAGIFGGPALADNTPLANLIAKYADRRMLAAIARERRKGRMLLIGTTNLDAARPVLWDMGRIAMSDHPQALNLFRKVLLASAAIPGVFPPVRIRVQAERRAYEELHVDGGVSNQVFVPPPSATVSSAGLSTQPLTRRIFIVRNGKIDAEWQPVEETTLSIIKRSLSTLTKNQGMGDLYRIYGMSQRDGVEFNLAAIPADFDLKSRTPFERHYMRALYDVGYQAGRKGYPWMKAPPGMAPKAHRPFSQQKKTLNPS